MDEKKIMIVNLAKGRVGESNARLLGSMLITKLYLAAMSRSDEKASNLAALPPFYLFVDEFQSFADRSFADILSESRKYKLSLTMAHQYIEQMDEEVREAVFGNVGTMIVFRVGAYDAEILEKEFAPTFTAEDLVNLGLRQIYLKLMIDSVTSPPFSATTTPPLKLPKDSYVDEIVKSSREKFARPKHEVEKDIIDWHEAGREAIARQERRVQTQPPKAEPERPKPQERVHLNSLKRQSDNQRKPDARHVSDLRNALKDVLAKEEVKGGEFSNRPEKTPPPKSPSPDELKKILDA